MDRRLARYSSLAVARVAGITTLMWVTSCSAVYSITGDDKSTPAPSDAGAAPGTAGGACYPNATCNAGLDCVDGTCGSSMDGGASSRRDASSTDTPDASSPGTGGGDAGGCNAPIKLLTANNCGIGMLKCLAEQVCYTTPEQCLTEESDRGVSCHTSVECGQGNVCCALLPNVDLNACPVKAKPLNDSSFSTACRKSCPSPELPICAKTVDCAAGKRCVAASSPGAFLIGQIVDFGVCL